MISVSIVGGMGCGKTTALGLLHEALTSFALRNRENFKFTPDLLSTAYLGNDVLVPMQTGRFPKKTEAGSREEVKLFLKFKKTFGWKELELNSYDISGEDLNQTLQDINAAKSMTQIIADLKQRRTLAALLESQVFIFIIDSMSCDPTQNPEIAEKKINNDLFLQKLWLAIKEYQKRVRREIKGIGLIFSKYDEAKIFLPLGEVDYYSLSDLQQSPEFEKETQSATKSFDEVVKTYLPRTYVAMDYNSKGNKVQNLKYFRSGIIMNREEGEQAQKYPVAIPLTFSANEYIRMAQWLSEL